MSVTKFIVLALFTRCLSQTISEEEQLAVSTADYEQDVPRSCLGPVPYGGWKGIALFKHECPADNIGHEVCEEVNRLVEGGAKLYAKSRRLAYSKGQQISRVKFVAEHYAPLVVIDQDFCFNLYGPVKPGDVFQADCRNPLLDGRNRILLYASVFVAGNFFVSSSGTHAGELKYIIGDGWYGLGAADVNTAEARDGPFPNFALWIGGSVISSVTTTITYNPAEQDAGLGGSDTAQRIQPRYTPLSTREVAKGRWRIKQVVCGLSRLIRSYRITGSVRLSGNVRTEVQIEIKCDKQQAMCIVDVPASIVFSSGRFRIKFVVEDASSVLVNVAGKVRSSTVAFDAPPGVPVVWNFFEADYVDWTVALDDVDQDGDAFYGTILAPRATHIALRYDSTVTGTAMYGSVLAGAAEGTTSLVNLDSISASDIHFPASPAKVIYCHCLFPQKKEDAS